MVAATLAILGVAVLTLPPVLEDGSSPPVTTPASPTETDWPTTPTTPPDTGFIAVYPNPITPNDAGEYVTITIDTPLQAGAWTITDNETTATIPATNTTGIVHLTDDPTNVTTPDDRPVLELDGRLSLTNAGERLALQHNNTTIDTITYPATAEYERYTNGHHEPLGATTYHPTSSTPNATTTFVFPDTPTIPTTTLRTATDRIYLAGYTLTSHRITTHLVRAARHGVDVRVLLEGGPAGGTSHTTPQLVDRLQHAGVTVRVVDGPRTRWRFHHAKYAVVDDRVIVLTENWVPAGTGGRATRGWGTRLTDPTIADRLATIFTTDHHAPGTRTWNDYETDTEFQPPTPATGSFHPRFPATSPPVDDAQLLVTPDNAERRLLELLRSATDSIKVLQPTIGNETPLLAELVAAARRGVTVDILLGGTWFMAQENTHLRDRLQRIARTEHLALSVRLIEPRSRFEYLHAKGLIVDGDQVVVGSINWNTVSTRENREVAVLLNGSGPAQYYRRVFQADWRGAAWRLPIGTLLLASIVATTTPVIVGRVVTFGGQPGAPRRSQRPPSSQPTHREQAPASRERT